MIFNVGDRVETRPQVGGTHTGRGRVIAIQGRDVYQVLMDDFGRAYWHFASSLRLLTNGLDDMLDLL